MQSLAHQINDYGATCDQLPFAATAAAKKKANKTKTLGNASCYRTILYIIIAMVASTLVLVGGSLVVGAFQTDELHMNKHTKKTRRAGCGKHSDKFLDKREEESVKPEIGMEEPAVEDEPVAVRTGEGEKEKSVSEPSTKVVEDTDGCVGTEDGNILGRVLKFQREESGLISNLEHKFNCNAEAAPVDNPMLQRVKTLEATNGNLLRSLLDLQEKHRTRWGLDSGLSKWETLKHQLESNDAYADEQDSVLELFKLKKKIMMMDLVSKDQPDEEWYKDQPGEKWYPDAWRLFLPPGFIPVPKAKFPGQVWYQDERTKLEYATVEEAEKFHDEQKRKSNQNKKIAEFVCCVIVAAIVLVGTLVGAFFLVRFILDKAIAPDADGEDKTKFAFLITAFLLFCLCFFLAYYCSQKNQGLRW